MWETLDGDAGHWGKSLRSRDPGVRYQRYVAYGRTEWELAANSLAIEHTYFIVLLSDADTASPAVL